MTRTTLESKALGRAAPSESRRNKKRSFDSLIASAGTDYADYVNTTALFACQKSAGELVNADELAFQIAHQVEELWMKLLCHTLIDLEGSLLNENTTRALEFLERAHHL